MRALWTSATALGLVFLALTCGVAAQAPGPEKEQPSPSSSIVEIDAVMPPFPTTREDEYLCTSVQLPDQAMKLIGIESLSDQGTVHHMLLFGCQAPAKEDKVWPCRMTSACSRGGENVMYGWGKNAPAVHLPEGVGFSVGPGTSIPSVVLQVHYLNLRPEGDESGVRLRLAPTPVPYSAGLIAFAAGFEIPPNLDSYIVPNECCYSGFETLHGFAYRVHTHALGRNVALERSIPAGDGEWSPRALITEQDPQKPQGFYNIDPPVAVRPGDRLNAFCDFNSAHMDTTVSAGHTSSDEMCNLYLMLYSELPFFMWCVDGNEWIHAGTEGMPETAVLVPEEAVWAVPRRFPEITLPLPPTTTTTVNSGGEGDPVVMPLGQVSGLAAGGTSNPSTGNQPTIWAFHRGFRTWTGSSFNSTNHFTKTDAIRWPAVLLLDRDTGALRGSWGADAFYMPHMMSSARDGGVWLVDVALHQVFKMSAKGEQEMVLGRRMEPGSGKDAFCKPTHAIEGADGTVYVADGYCNSRIVKFSPSGKFLAEFKLPRESKDGGSPAPLPHSIALDECRRRLYVADREAGRVLAIHIDSGKVQGKYQLGEKYGLPYAVRIGPYGVPLVLTWDREGTGLSHLVALSTSPPHIEASWVLEGVEAPHDLEVVPAPLSVTGTGERLLSVMVAETAPRGSSIKKFIIVEQAVDKNSKGDNVGDEEGLVDDEKEMPAGLAASHAGHAMLKPVDDDGTVAEEVAREQETEAALVVDREDEEIEKAFREEEGEEQQEEAEEEKEEEALEERIEEAAAAEEEEQQEEEHEKEEEEAVPWRPNTEITGSDQVVLDDMDLDTQVPASPVSVRDLARNPVALVAVAVVAVGSVVLLWKNVAGWRNNARGYRSSGYRPPQHIA